jgi:hypothetical protein
MGLGRRSAAGKSKLRCRLRLPAAADGDGQREELTRCLVMTSADGRNQPYGILMSQWTEERYGCRFGVHVAGKTE